MSPVMGKGFNLNAIPLAEVDTLLLFATGTGIAPIRALLLAERLQVRPRPLNSITNYHGESTSRIAPLRRAALPRGAASFMLRSQLMMYVLIWFGGSTCSHYLPNGKTHSYPTRELGLYL